MVVQELQRGYRFGERVIRPTMVKVGLPPPRRTATAPDEATAVPSEAADVVDSDGASESSGDAEQPVAS